MHLGRSINRCNSVESRRILYEYEPFPACTAGAVLTFCNYVIVLGESAETLRMHSFTSAQSAAKLCESTCCTMLTAFTIVHNTEYCLDVGTIHSSITWSAWLLTCTVRSLHQYTRKMQIKGFNSCVHLKLRWISIAIYFYGKVMSSFLSLSNIREQVSR